LAVVDVASGRRYDLGALGKPVQLSWSPDSQLAAVKSGGLYLAAPPDWTPRRVGGFPAVPVEWSPDGSRIAFVQRTGVGISVPELSDVRTLDGAFADRRIAPAWSPDGTRLAFGRSDGAYVVEVDRVEIRRIADGDLRGAGPERVLFWSPDGSAVAVVRHREGSRGSDVMVAPADGSGAYRLAGVTDGDVRLLAWTDGGIIAYVQRYP
jgi:Tol biopolymer transport system component